jgi:S-DNA-T family DNA segregation ATPase FtsK/SpoIIIE
VYVDLLTAGPHFLAFGDSESGKTTLLRAWVRYLDRHFTPEQVRFGILDYRRRLLEFLDSPLLIGYGATAQMAKELIDTLKRELEGRLLTSGSLTIEELRNPTEWAGPHYFLFVDDYETVVTATGSPLAPLGELIQQGRDVGLHVVLTRRVAGMGRGAFEAVLQRLKETGSPGLVLNGDPQEGAVLGTQRAGALPPGRGYLVRRNQRTLLVQTFLAEPSGAS